MAVIEDMKGASVEGQRPPHHRWPFDASSAVRLSESRWRKNYMTTRQRDQLSLSSLKQPMSAIWRLQKDVAASGGKGNANAGERLPHRCQTYAIRTSPIGNKMDRGDKPPFKRVPPEMIEKIPEILRKPDEILWELRHERGEDVHTLLYVKHLKGRDVVKAADSINDRNRAKFVVKVDVDAYFQQGGKRIQRQGNWVWSAGRVATRGLESYERVWP